LAALPTDEYNRLAPSLETVPLILREVLYESADPITHVYFPTRSVISLLTPREEKEPGIEVGAVGPEGMAGLASFLGLETTPLRWVVQVAGEALRMRVEDFRALVGREGVLCDLLMRYTHAFLIQVAQSLACNVLHQAPQRMCRWLLFLHSRVSVNEFPLTQDYLAALLGVRRATVSDAARTLQERGLIEYERGRITVLDWDRLEGFSCNCHRCVQEHFDRLFA
jgi:CRP-like cAMP-binding protein